MEIRIPVLELSKALMMLQGVVQKKNTMPILSNILLETSTSSDGQGQLTLTATDLDVGMRTIKICEVVEPGSITVQARACIDIVKMLAGPDVVMKTLPNQQVSIKSGRTQAKLLALPAEEFPSFPAVDGTSFKEIDVTVFTDMIQKTLYSTSLDENRYNLTGVYLEPQKEKPNHLTMVSTDGHRLTRIEKAFEQAMFSDLTPVILPRKGLTELLRLLDNQQVSEQTTFEIGFFNNQAIVRRGSSILAMRLIDGKFPDYQQVIPKLSDKILRASRTDLLTSIKRVSVLADDKNQYVKLFAKAGEVRISCVNPETGEVSDDIAVEYNGPEIEIGFNVRYIIEALSSLSEHNIMLKLTDSLSPALLTGISNDQHLCVVMPMRI